MTQLELFCGAHLAPALPFQRASATSRAAAEQGREGAATARERVFEFISGRGERGATRDEAARGLNMRIQTVCGRVNDLMRAGRVLKTAQTRRTESGCAAEVLIAFSI